MRNLAILSLIVSSLTCSAQEGVTFKTYFKPNKTYKTTITASSISETEFSGNPEIIEKMKASGASVPMYASVSNITNTTTITGEYSADLSFPAKIVYDQVTTTQLLKDIETKKEQPSSGLIIMGFYDRESKLRIDTMISNTMDESAKKVFKLALDTEQQQIKFPETPLKIGESFDQKSPMRIPAGGLSPVNVVTITNYKLVEIKGNKAIFDILTNLTIDTSTSKPGVSITGEGIGVSEFDMINNIITRNESDFTMKVKMTVNGLLVSSKTISKSQQLVTVVGVSLEYK